MLAATGGLLPDTAWLYFALAQFPIYLSPQLFTPLARRLATGAPGAPTCSVAAARAADRS
jgi:BASS family bile acid:Na+ symporter